MKRQTRPDYSVWRCKTCGEVLFGIQAAVTHITRAHGVKGPAINLSRYFIPIKP